MPNGVVSVSGKVPEVSDGQGEGQAARDGLAGGVVVMNRRA